MSYKIKGELEIDADRGVIYFHSESGQTIGQTLVRICKLPTPIPLYRSLLDITHMHGCSWKSSP